MLFVAYESLSERPRQTATWLRQRLEDFYPFLPAGVLQKRGAMVRQSQALPYDELILVGHSLGGVVLRLALHQQAKIWLSEERAIDPAAPRPPLLEAQVRLFSPASAGFQPTGLPALLTCLLTVGKFAWAMSPAYTSLKAGSDLLTSTRAHTEALVEEHGADLAALRARIVWARPETVVEPDGYETDYEADSLLPERNHVQVCKPHDGYEEPRRFVETGRHRD